MIVSAFFNQNEDIDARIAIILLLFGMILTFYINNFISLIFLFLFYILLYINLSQRHSKRIFSIFVIYFMLLGLSNFLFSFLDLNEFIVSILRFWILSLSFNWFFLNTKPESLTQALIWFRFPYHWAWTISSAFRFITFFQRETNELINAQLVRGIPLDGSIFEKIKSIGPLIVPLVYRTQIVSQQFGEALFARGWIPAGKKTFLYPLAFSRKDFIYSSIFIILIIFARFFSM